MEPNVRFCIDHDPEPSCAFDGDWFSTTEEEYAEMGPIELWLAPRKQMVDRKSTRENSRAQDQRTHSVWCSKGCDRQILEPLVTQHFGYAIATAQPLSWDEYKVTYGDPENYSVYMIHLEVQCTCCKNWEDTFHSCGGISYYKEYLDTGTFELDKIEDEHMREIANDLLGSWRYERKEEAKALEEALTAATAMNQHLAEHPPKGHQ